MELVGWGLQKLNIFSHNFSTVAVVFAAQALLSRLCGKWPGMDEMALYEATIKYRDVKGCKRRPHFVGNGCE